MILINRAFSEVTPESAEEGEFSDMGMIAEDVPCTFLELVRLLKDHPQASSSRCNGDIGGWFSTGIYTPNDGWADGTDREETVHYSRNNPPHNARYWRLACIAAGHC